jgi:nitrate reductase beta subunit
MKRLLICALASSLAACASPPQVQQPLSPVTHVVTQTAEVTVPVLCVDRIPEPRLPLSEPAQILAAGSGYQVVMRYDREIELRDSYEADLKKSLMGCLKATSGLKPAPLPPPKKPG